MIHYALRRLLLIIPTLMGIMIINFIIVQAAPGGPVDQMIAKLRGFGSDVTARVSGSSTGFGESSSFENNTAHTGGESKYAGAQGLDPDFVKELEKLYGFDQPAHVRLWKMIKSYIQFDFGQSYFKDQNVIDLILDKLPVSISLGLWSTLLIYLISIPLGIRKAVKDGSPFDVATSGIVVVGYAIPAFLFAILLIVLFAGGSFWKVFPLRGLTSDDWDTMTWGAQIIDYFWHIALPVAAMTISGFASLTLLTKNSFLDEIGKQYVVTARAKGLEEKRILYGHVFRNAMLIVIAGMPGAFVQILFTGSLLIEVIFSLDGLGLLGFEAAVGRDYPVMFGTLYIFTMISLFLHLIGDLTYMFVDPRIDFESRPE
jgi:microcin C transport system permease protein